MLSLKRYRIACLLVALNITLATTTRGQELNAPLEQLPPTLETKQQPAYPPTPPAAPAYNNSDQSPATLPADATQHANESVQLDIERGQPRPVLDVAGWVIGAPKKLLMWDSRVDNHEITDETVDKVAGYLATNNMTDTKVRVNQYDPLGEWRRLVQNKRINPCVKYTFGTVRNLRYTFLPGRLFGGDEYNPYTNTVSMYSDVPAIGIVESAYARDVQTRELPGLYAAAQSLPLVSLWHETLATDETLQYIAIEGTPEEIAATRKTLYARYGIQLGGELAGFAPNGGVLFEVVGAGAGHIAAWRENAK